MRTNLSSLKALANQMSKTQNVLSTGKRVNSAIDNASNYYQARALTNRAADLNALLDSMGQGIQTIEAATQGLTAATSILEQASAVAVNAAISTTGNSEIRLSTIDIELYKAAGYEVMTVDNANEMLTKIQAGNGRRYKSKPRDNIW